MMVEGLALCRFIDAIPFVHIEPHDLAECILGQHYSKIIS
jgi:hypothetical protein